MGKRGGKKRKALTLKKQNELETGSVSRPDRVNPSIPIISPTPTPVTTTASASVNKAFEGKQSLNINTNNNVTSKTPISFSQMIQEAVMKKVITPVVEGSTPVFHSLPESDRVGAAIENEKKRKRSDDFGTTPATTNTNKGETGQGPKLNFSLGSLMDSMVASMFVKAGGVGQGSASSSKGVSTTLTPVEHSQSTSQVSNIVESEGKRRKSMNQEDQEKVNVVNDDSKEIPFSSIFHAASSSFTPVDGNKKNNEKNDKVIVNVSEDDSSKMVIDVSSAITTKTDTTTITNDNDNDNNDNNYDDVVLLSPASSASSSLEVATVIDPVNFPTPPKWPFSISPYRLARAASKMQMLRTALLDLQSVLCDENLVALTKIATQSSKIDPAWHGFEEHWKRLVPPKNRMKLHNVMNVIKDVIGTLEPDVLGIELSRFVKALCNTL